MPPSFLGDPAVLSSFRLARKYAPPPLNDRIEEGAVTPALKQNRETLSAKTARMINPYGGERNLKRLLRKKGLEQNEARISSVRSSSNNRGSQSESQLESENI